MQATSNRPNHLPTSAEHAGYTTLCGAGLGIITIPSDRYFYLRKPICDSLAVKVENIAKFNKHSAIMSTPQDIESKAGFRPSSPSEEKREEIFQTRDDGDLSDDIYGQVNPARPGFTKNDQKDMYRMGKIQEFKVCRPLLISRKTQ